MRVNVEERFWAEGQYRVLGRIVDWGAFDPEDAAIAKLIKLWRHSQNGREKAMVASRDQILDWTETFTESARTSLFNGLLRTKFIADNGDGNFVIKGNKKQIEALEKHFEKSAMGGQATKERYQKARIGNRPKRNKLKSKQKDGDSHRPATGLPVASHKPATGEPQVGPITITNSITTPPNRGRGNTRLRATPPPPFDASEFRLTAAEVIRTEKLMKAKAIKYALLAIGASRLGLDYPEAETYLREKSGGEECWDTLKNAYISWRNFSEQCHNAHQRRAGHFFQKDVVESLQAYIDVAWTPRVISPSDGDNGQASQ